MFFCALQFEDVCVINFDLQSLTGCWCPCGLCGPGTVSGLGRLGPGCSRRERLRSHGPGRQVAQRPQALDPRRNSQPQCGRTGKRRFLLHAKLLSNLTCFLFRFRILT